MAKAQKDAIKKELLDRATGKGKEPSWEGEPTKLDLVKALNFYFATVETAQLQNYAIAWAKKFRPTSVELIEAQPKWKFHTIGALMRMQSRGLELTKACHDQIDQFVSGLEMPAIKPTISTAKRKKKMSDAENANYRNFCDALDKAVEAKDFVDPKLKPEKGHDTAPVIEVCQRELESIKEDPSIYPEHMKKWFRAVIKSMNDGKLPMPANDPVKAATKVARVVGQPWTDPDATDAKTDTPAPKAKKKPKTGSLPKKDPDPNAPCPLKGKKKAYIFDPRYGRLTKLVSNSKEGFSVTGKTIHGIDASKSKVALLKNYGDAMKPCAETDFEAWMKKCVKKGNPIAVSTRFAEELIVLQAA